MATITFPSSMYYYHDSEFVLDSGEQLSSFTLAYETFGELNPDKSNAILIFHALSGSAHVTRSSKDFEENKGIKGWWEKMVGPGMAFDTDKYFIICINVLGSCYGSTGPSSINPDSKVQFSLNFPILTIHDMVKSQKLLIDSLGIDILLTITGGSMGGMMAIDWALNYPESIRSIIPISTTPQSSSQNIAFNEVGRQAILADPKWNNGNYYGGKSPDLGLSIARMIGHITYLSDESMRDKFGRRLRNENGTISKFQNEFEVESYLSYKGESFTKRFDANSYLYITKAIDYFDMYSDKRIQQAQEDKNDMLEKLKFLIVTFTADWLYPVRQSKNLVNYLRKINIPVSYCQIESSYGHDAFLIETEQQSLIIREFLKNISRNI